MIRKIKVFLVEDEGIIRSGVKKSINWEQEGYEFVGEASDGELAYPMILKEKPDSVLPTLGGQAALNLAMELDESGFLVENRVRMIGTSSQTIKKAEDRLHG